MQTSMSFEEIVAAIQARRFLPSKPIREIRPIDLQRNPRIVASRKYNGNFAAAVVKSPGDVEFYTASNLYLTSLRDSPWFEGGEWKSALNDAAPGTFSWVNCLFRAPASKTLGLFRPGTPGIETGVGNLRPRPSFSPSTCSPRQGDLFTTGPTKNVTRLYPQRCVWRPHLTKT
jgi:hypothetical protein